MIYYNTKHTSTSRIMSSLFYPIICQIKSLQISKETLIIHLKHFKSSKESFQNYRDKKVFT